MRQGIAVAGSILVDKIYEISTYPHEGELTQIRSIGYSVGGLVPNDAIDIKRARPDIPVLAIGTVGDDAEGEFVLSTLRQNGVDTKGVAIKKGEKTSFTDVMSVSGGQRTFFTYPGASASFGKDDIDFDALSRSCKMLHLGYFLLLDKVDNGDGLEILKEAKSRGIMTSIDLVSENSDRYSAILPCLSYVDNLIVNELEAGRLCGMEPRVENLPEIAKKLKELGVRERVIIHTPDLSVCCGGADMTVLPSYRLPEGHIKGTTGAGDAYCSGALIGIYEGKSDLEILKMATVLAACSLGSADATGGIDNYEQMESFCDKLMRKSVPTI